MGIVDAVKPIAERPIERREDYRRTLKGSKR